MPTRTRSKKPDPASEVIADTPIAQYVPSHSPIETATPGILRNADMLAELHKQRDEISMLSQKAAASEERAYHMSSSIKELTAQHVDAMKQMQDQLRELQSRLVDVERMGRKMVRAMRNDAREGLAEVRGYVQEQKQARQEDVKHVTTHMDMDDEKSTVSLLRAESMLKNLADNASEVGSVVSHCPRFR